MNITQGEFKDIYECSNGRSSRTSQSKSRFSLHESISSSLELLPSEKSYISRDIENDCKEFATNSDEASKPLLSNVSILNTFNKSDSSSMKNLSSSLSDNSFDSNSSGTECNDIEDHEIDSLDPVKTPEQIEMEKAIKKMQKLDKILMGKMKKEREVKHQRLLMQKSFYTDLEKLKVEDKIDSYSDVRSNTNKYLALMPPSQQLDVLLEQHQAVDDFEPIFQTQVYSQPPTSAQSQDRIRTNASENRPKLSANQNEKATEKSGREKKSKSQTGSSKGKRSKQDESKTNFIERNIQLAKDAGNMIAMTEEEKERLDFLLKDIDDVEGNKTEEKIPFQVTATSYGVGFEPDQGDATQLHEIDSRLQALLSPAVFTSISSSSLLRRNLENTSYEMIEIGRKIAKSSLHEAVSPEQRLDEIDDKLSRLSEQWKERKFDQGRPHLDDDQLHRLLDECSRATSPDSITTSNFSKLEFRDNLSSSESFKSCDSSSFRSSSDPTQEESRSSSRSSDSTFTPDIESSRSKPPTLDRRILDELLIEAKLSLGISDFRKDDVTEDEIQEALSS